MREHCTPNSQNIDSLTLSFNSKAIPGHEVIKLEYSLKLKIKRNDWLSASNQSIIALYFEFENELKFYNLGAWYPKTSL